MNCLSERYIKGQLEQCEFHVYLYKYCLQEILGSTENCTQLYQTTKEYTKQTYLRNRPAISIHIMSYSQPMFQFCLIKDNLPFTTTDKQQTLTMFISTSKCHLFQHKVPYFLQHLSIS